MTPDPVHITDDIEVQDAFINFSNASFTEGEELVVVVDEHPSHETAFPVPETETGSKWYARNEQGVWWGFNDGEVGVPANTDPITKTYPIEHETIGVEDRVLLLSHEVQRVVNAEYENAVQVTFYNSKGYPKTIPVALSTAEEILEQYVGGPLGSNVKTRFRYKREIVGNTRWGSAVSTNEAQLERVENMSEFTFVKDSTRGWIPQPVAFVE